MNNNNDNSSSNLNPENASNNKSSSNNSRSNNSTSNNCNQESSVINISQAQKEHHQTIHNSIIHTQLEIYNLNEQLNSVTNKIQLIEIEQLDKKNTLDEVTLSLREWKNNKRRVAVSDPFERAERTKFIIESLENKIVALLVRASKRSDKIKDLRHQFEIERQEINRKKDKLREFTQQVIDFRYQVN